MTVVRLTTIRWFEVGRGLGRVRPKIAGDGSGVHLRGYEAAGEVDMEEPPWGHDYEADVSDVAHMWDTFEAEAAGDVHVGIDTTVVQQNGVDIGASGQPYEDDNSSGKVAAVSYSVASASTTSRVASVGEEEVVAWAYLHKVGHQRDEVDSWLAVGWPAAASSPRPHRRLTPTCAENKTVLLSHIFYSPGGRAIFIRQAIYGDLGGRLNEHHVGAKGAAVHSRFDDRVER